MDGNRAVRGDRARAATPRGSENQSQRRPEPAAVNHVLRYAKACIPISVSIRGKTKSPTTHEAFRKVSMQVTGLLPAGAAAGHQIRISRSSAQSELIPNTHSPPTPGFVTCEPCGGTQPCVASHTQYVYAHKPCIVFLFRGRDDVPSGPDSVMLDLIDGRAPVVAWCGLVWDVCHFSCMRAGHGALKCRGQGTGP